MGGLCRAMFFSLLFISGNLWGQERLVDKKGVAWSFVDRVTLPQQDNEELRQKYDYYKVAQGPGPNTFAEAISCYIDCRHTGTWESTDDGYMVWRQLIQSKGAYSLNLAFTKFHLPPSARVYIADTDQSIIVGPLTSDDNDDHGEWWSPIFPGEEIMIEVLVAPKDVPDLKIIIEQVNHDFSGFGGVLSGSCNLDVICGENDGFGIAEKYRDVINSAGRLTIGGVTLCSGSLVNNTRNDCTPYIITAEHCEITTNNANSVVVTWNFQNSTCREPGSIESGGLGDGPSNEFNSGAILRATFARSDFTLIELDDSIDPLSNPFFLGWDRSTQLGDTLASVHHPRGDEKRISFDFDAPEFFVNEVFVRVGNWEIGTTERGSSGGALVTTEQRLIGMLSRGDAACGNSLQDDYGMFISAWDGGGSPETRIKDWLDPDGSDVMSIAGRYCSSIARVSQTSLSICRSESPSQTIQITAEAGFDQPGMIRVLEAPAGIDISFSDTEISTEETIDVTLEVNEDFQDNSGVVTLRIENDLGPSDIMVTIDVFDVVPERPFLVSPIDGAIGLDFFVDLEWSTDGEFSRLEISQRPDFSDTPIILTDLVENNQNIRDLEVSTTYFWRVLSSNACGDSEYSDIRSFRTGSIVCTSFNPTDLPISIGTDPEIISSSLQVETDGSISDINVVDLQMRHTWITDLTITLISPSGTRVRLLDTPCAGEDDIDASFDDESDLINLDCPLTTGRTFRPLDPLEILKSENPNGIWTLEVNDAIAEDGGQLLSWTLELCINKSSQRSIAVEPSFIEVCDKDLSSFSFELSLEGDWANPSNVTVATGSGQAVPITYDPNPIGEAREITITIDDPSVLLGRDQIDVEVFDGGSSLRQSISVVHIEEGTSPTLVSPPNQAEDQRQSPDLTWTSGGENIEAYVIRVSNDELFENIAFQDTVTELTAQVLSTLEEVTTYFWEVTALGRCRDYTSEPFSFVTGVEPATIDPSLAAVRIYPSPVDAIITIDLSDVVDAKLIDIYDLTGRHMLSSERTEAKEQKIDVSGLAEGIYFLRLSSEAGIYSMKFVVAR